MNINYQRLLKVTTAFLGRNWIALSGIIGGSFFLASVISIIVGRALLSTDDINRVGKVPSSAGTTIELTLPEGTVTLNNQAVQKILHRNIFNSEGPAEDPLAGGQKTEKTPQDDKPVKSDLPLKLLGTIYAGNSLLGIALVENTEKNLINSFMVGDMLVEGVVILEVGRDRVILSRNGRKEFIELAKTELIRSRRDKKKSKKVITSSDEPTPLATEPPPDAFKEDGFERKGDQVEMSGSYRERLLSSDMAKVLQDAKATPNMVGGELKGFILDRIRKDSIYEKSGFQNGDIIEEINGISLNDTAQSIKLLNSLRGESEIEIRYKRGGKWAVKALNVR